MAAQLVKMDGIEVPGPGDWTFDPDQTQIGFVARHLMVTKVRGFFRDFTLSVHVGNTLEESWAEATIQAASVDTGVHMRDEHLRSRDFFDIDNHKEITFKSTKLEKTGKTSLKMTGDLTVGTVTKPLTLDVEYEGAVRNAMDTEIAIFSLSAEIDREDWGVTWNLAIESGGFLVGPKVKIEIDVALMPVGG